jgi:hypothetical protein
VQRDRIVPWIGLPGLLVAATALDVYERAAGANPASTGFVIEAARLRGGLGTDTRGLNTMP